MNRAILQHCFCWFGDTGPFPCQLQSVLVAVEPWTGAQRAFALKAFYKNGDSFVIVQREFRREFGIHRNRAVPSAHAKDRGSKLRGYWFYTKEERNIELSKKSDEFLWRCFKQ